MCAGQLIDSTIYMYDRNIWKGAQINSIILLDHSFCVATDDGAFMLDSEGHLISEFHGWKTN